MHGIALERVKAILDAPMYTRRLDKDGNEVGSPVLDTKAAGLMLKAYQLLDVRLRGGYTQRIEQKSLSVKMHGKGYVDVNSTVDEPMDMRSIDAKIQELQKVVGANPHMQIEAPAMEPLVAMPKVPTLEELSDDSET
jgi:hypothetical protein